MKRDPHVRALVAVVLLAAALRVVGSLNELWLDEVWSLEMARQVASPVEIFTVAKHDNNHFLNTLWLYAFRGHDAPALLRAHSLAAGIASVLLAWIVARRWGGAAGLLAAILTAFSYPMLLYSSEARGYALAACFGLLAFLLLEARAAALFSVVAILGFLSHLTFLHVYVGLLAWSADRWMRERRRAKAIAREVLSFHAVPLVVVAALWWISLRGRAVGGGSEPGVTSLDGVLDAMSLLVGGPLHGAGRMLCGLAALVALGLVLRGLQVAWRSSRGSAVFFAVAAVVSPLVLTPLLSPGFLFPRYFLVSAAVAILLVAAALGDLWERGRAPRVASVVIAALVIAGGAVHATQLLRYGRGEYEAPLRLLASRSAARPLVVSGDHELRVGFVLAHYARKVLPDREVLYRNAPAGPPAAVAGYIANSLETRPDTPLTIRDVSGRILVRTGVWRHAPLSGATWVLYLPER